jgi:hypothetical protein
MRYAYFRGCGASAAEATRAVQIAHRTGQRLDSDPALKAEVEVLPPATGPRARLGAARQPR